MKVYAVGISLPNPMYYYLFHAHTHSDRAVWLPGDRDLMMDMVDWIRRIHDQPEQELPKLTREQREAFYVEGLDAEEACQRLNIYRIHADRRYQGAQLIHKVEDQASNVAPMDTSKMAGGFYHLAVSRGAPFSPTPEVVQAMLNDQGPLATLVDPTTLEEKPITEFQRGDLIRTQQGELVSTQSLAVRGGRWMVNAVYREKENASTQGLLRVVLVPNDAHLKPMVVNTKSNELIVEQARCWPPAKD